MKYKNKDLRLWELQVQLKYFLWGMSVYSLIVLLFSSSNYLNHCHAEECT